MQEQGHLRYYLIEVAISVVLGAAFGGFFTFMLLGFGTSVPPFGRRLIALDFLPQTFMTALLSYLIPAMLTRARLRKRRLSQFQRGLVWTNSLPFVWQCILVPPIFTSTFGVIAALLIYFYVPIPTSIGAVVLLKMLYSGMLAAILTTYAISSALSCRRMRATLSSGPSPISGSGF